VYIKTPSSKELGVFIFKGNFKKFLLAGGAD
jgi:hypothetical protein